MRSAVRMGAFVPALGLAILFAQFSLAQTLPKTAGSTPPPSSPAFVIAVDGPTPPVHLESPLTVNITVTNVSKKEIWWEWYRATDSDSGYKAFAFLVTRGGHEVETTFFYRKISNRQRSDDPQEVMSGSLFPVTYPPGKMFTVTIDLKRLYEIKEPGVYKLVVSRPDENSKTTVRSNPLTLKVGP